MFADKFEQRKGHKPKTTNKCQIFEGWIREKSFLTTPDLDLQRRHKIKKMCFSLSDI